MKCFLNYNDCLQVDSAYHEFFLKDLDITLITVMGFLVVILTLSAIRVILHVSVRGIFTFLHDWRNLMDIIILFFGFFTITASVTRAVYFKTYSETFNQPVKDMFVSFVFPFYQNDFVNVLLSIFILLTALRLISLSNYGKYFFIVSRALGDSIKYIFALIILNIATTVIISAIMYSCDTQHITMFSMLPFPRQYFKHFQKRGQLQTENIVFPIVVNYVHLFSTALTICVIIYSYGNTKFQLKVYGEGEESKNRFPFMFRGFSQWMRTVFIGVHKSPGLRLRGGSSFQENAMKWYGSPVGLGNTRECHSNMGLKNNIPENESPIHLPAEQRRHYENILKNLDKLIELFDTGVGTV